MAKPSHQTIEAEEDLADDLNGGWRVQNSLWMAAGFGGAGLGPHLEHLPRALMTVAGEAAPLASATSLTTSLGLNGRCHRVADWVVNQRMRATRTRDALQSCNRVLWRVYLATTQRPPRTQPNWGSTRSRGPCVIRLAAVGNK
jgi:hypothetical protein